MNAPTPGPWHVETGTPSGRRLVADLVEGDLRLTHYRIVHDGESEGDGEADANFIASAPDLLAALHHALEWLEIEGCDCGTDEPGTCALCEAGAAVRKAEGRMGP